MKDVFISFSSIQSDEAKKICDFLEKNNISCFISFRDLVAGQQYAEQLLQNIDSSKVVILVLSKESNESPHVLREIEHAVSHNIPIIVFPLEEVNISKSMEYFLMTHQWISLTDDRYYKLLAGIKALINPAASDNSVNDAAPVDEIYKTISKRRRNMFIIISAVILIVGIAIGIYAYIRANTFDVNLGDTYTFASYHDTPIEWCVIDIDEDAGTMTLISEKIISMKAYDAPECGTYNYYNDEEYWTLEKRYIDDPDLLIKIRGNNDWGSSNLRTWLNSADNVVKYTDYPPTRGALGNNAYDFESGFLHGFTEKEQSCLVPTDNEGSSDYVYLLSSQELDLLNNADIHIYAKPSQTCLEYDENIGYYEDLRETYSSDYFYWWLRDSSGEQACEAYLVTTDYDYDEVFISTPVGGYSFGVRPAIKVNIKSFFKCIE